MREVVYEYVKGTGWVLAPEYPSLPCSVEIGKYYQKDGTVYRCMYYGDLPDKNVPIYPMGRTPWGSGPQGAEINPTHGTLNRQPRWVLGGYEEVWVLVRATDVSSV